MNRSIRANPVISSGLVLAALAVSTGAAAEDPPAPQPAAVAAPVAPAPAPPSHVAGASDHDLVVGHLGFGWLGTRDIPVGPAPAAPPLGTPVVGIRYWATPLIGIDAGLGFFAVSGSQTVTPPGTSTDAPSRTTFVLHAGVPLALAGAGHFSFQVTPEVDVGFGSGSVQPVPPSMGPSTDLSGFLLQVGARAGAEIHFGFIGIPQLALDASIGAFLASTTGKATTGPTSTKSSSLVITTTTFAQPWDIFRSAVAARYYF